MAKTIAVPTASSIKWAAPLAAWGVPVVAVLACLISFASAQHVAALLTLAVATGSIASVPFGLKILVLLIAAWLVKRALAARLPQDRAAFIKTTIKIQAGLLVSGKLLCLLLTLGLTHASKEHPQYSFLNGLVALTVFTSIGCLFFILHLLVACWRSYRFARI